MIEEVTIERLVAKYDHKFHIVTFLDYIAIYWNNQEDMVEYSHEVEGYLRETGYGGKIEDVFSGQHLF